jgi:hypothetical protein
VNNCCNLRARLAKADRHTVQWHQKAYLDFDLSKVTDPAEQMAPMPQQATKPISDNDADEIADTLNKSQSGISFIDIASIEFGYIANNLYSASMLDNKDQLLLFTIINRLHAINGLVAHVRDEYERSFAVATSNRPSIEANTTSYYDKIADQSYFAANEVVELLRANKASHPAP